MFTCRQLLPFCDRLILLVGQGLRLRQRDGGEAFSILNFCRQRFLNDFGFRLRGWSWRRSCCRRRGLFLRGLLGRRHGFGGPPLRRRFATFACRQTAFLGHDEKRLRASDRMAINHGVQEEMGSRGRGHEEGCASVKVKKGRRKERRGKIKNG